MKLLTGLGDLAHEHDLHVQSHICEQKPEVRYTLELFPEHKHSASIFEQARLLTEKVNKIIIIFNYASVGGAPRHTVVVVCVCVSAESFPELVLRVR